MTEVALHGLDVATQIGADGFPQRADLVDEIEEDEVEVALTVTVGSAGATGELVKELLKEAAFAIAPVIPPDVAPAFSANGPSSPGTAWRPPGSSRSGRTG